LLILHIMETIIDPVNKKLLEAELTETTFLRNTNNGHNKIYVFTAHDSPNLMREVGRLREITFRDAGGGTGKSVDIDEFDIMEVPFHQLIVWDPVEDIGLFMVAISSAPMETVTTVLLLNFSNSQINLSVIICH
jgi:hypothetical protein